jgi:hypothetical protein
MTDTSPVEFDKDGWPERLILSRSHQSEIVEYMQPWGEADAEDRLYIRADTIAALRAAPVATSTIPGSMYGEFTPITVRSESLPLDAPALVDTVAEILERLAKKQDGIAAAAMNSLSCGSENRDFREAHEEADKRLAYAAALRALAQETRHD